MKSTNLSWKLGRAGKGPSVRVKLTFPLRMLLASALTLLLAPPAVVAAAAPQQYPIPSTASLPEPYSNWNVTLEPSKDNAQVLTLKFNSPLLDRRTTSTVFVPDSYTAKGKPSPVMYYLHGTVVPVLDNHLLDAVTGREYFLDMVAAGGGKRQTELFQFGSMLEKANFLVVAPDTSKKGSWCDSCGWIDGRQDLLPNVPPATAETVPANSYLHQELYPLIEALFNARTDRGGRGVMGFSMGGWAALTQGMKHPDKYSYVGSVTGAYDILAPLVRAEFAEPVGYLRDQGYGTSITHETWWRNFNPRDLASNFRGIDTHLMLSSGDGCLSLSSLGHPDCRTDPPLHVVAAEVEVVLSQNHKLAMKSLESKGIPAQSVNIPGVHGSNNHRVYSDYIVPKANAVFVSNTDKPESFSYRTVNPQFSVWGYNVAMERSSPHFLSMTKARTDGRSFTLDGVGKATVTTPDEFESGRTYTVTLSSHGGQQSQRSVTANPQGQLQIEVDLSSPRKVTVKVQ